MKNKVIAGDYKNCEVLFSSDKMYFMQRLNKTLITKSMVSNWDIVDDVENNSFWGPVVGAGLGSMLFGTLGAFAGAAIAGNKKNTTYMISIDFTDGKRSLLQLDTQGYNNLVKTLF